MVFLFIRAHVLYTRYVSGTDDTHYNLHIGFNALDAITTGDSNTAIGFSALEANTTWSMTILGIGRNRLRV